MRSYDDFVKVAAMQDHDYEDIVSPYVGARGSRKAANTLATLSSLYGAKKVYDTYSRAKSGGGGAIRSGTAGAAALGLGAYSFLKSRKFKKQEKEGLKNIVDYFGEGISNQGLSKRQKIGLSLALAKAEGNDISANKLSAEKDSFKRKLRSFDNLSTVDKIKMIERDRDADDEDLEGLYSQKPGKVFKYHKEWMRDHINFLQNEEDDYRDGSRYLRSLKPQDITRKEFKSLKRLYY